MGFHRRLSLQCHGCIQAQVTGAGGGVHHMLARLCDPDVFCRIVVAEGAFIKGDTERSRRAGPGTFPRNSIWIEVSGRLKARHWVSLLCHREASARGPWRSG